MPIYEYRCPVCQDTRELLCNSQKTEPENPMCYKCKVKMDRIVSPANIEKTRSQEWSR